MPYQSPYWPGTAFRIDANGQPPSAPRARRPIAAADLRPARACCGVKQTAWHVTPVADLQVEHAGRVALVLDQRIGAGMLDRDLVAVDHDGARARQHRPDAAGLVGAAVGAGLVLGLRPRAARSGASSGRTGASGSRSMPSSSWIARSVSS